MAKSIDYKVSITMDIRDHSPLRAAKTMRELLLNRNTNVVLTVQEDKRGSKPIHIDLEEHTNDQHSGH